MKKNKDTGVIICKKCGAELVIKLISRVRGYPSKVVFRCPTNKCTGGMMVQKKAVKKLSKETFEYYNLIKKR